MTIKNMIMAGLVCCGFTAALTSCSDNTEAFYTVSEDDGPRILNDDLKGSYEINHNENFVLNILVTPTEMTTVKWYDADRFVAEGKTINQLFETGEYNIKIVATTVQGKETYRNFKLTVNALDGEPVATSNDNSERVVKAGFTYDQLSKKQYEELVRAAKFEGYYEEARDEFEALKKKIDHHDVNRDMDLHRDEIQLMLEQDIVSAYYYQAGQVQVGLRNDKTLREAERILNTEGEYKRILQKDAAAE